MGRPKAVTVLGVLAILLGGLELFACAGSWHQLAGAAPRDHAGLLIVHYQTARTVAAACLGLVQLLCGLGLLGLQEWARATAVALMMARTVVKAGLEAWCALVVLPAQTWTPADLPPGIDFAAVQSTIAPVMAFVNVAITTTVAMGVIYLLTDRTVVAACRGERWRHGGSAPLDQFGPPPARRPRWLNVLIGVMVLTGLMLLLAMGLTLVLLFGLLPAMAPSLTPEQLASAKQAMLLLVPLELAAAAVALVAAKGLFDLQPWARKLTIAYGIYRCVSVLVSAAIEIFGSPAAVACTSGACGRQSPALAVVSSAVWWLLWLWALNLLSLPETVRLFERASVPFQTNENHSPAPLAQPPTAQS